MYVSTDPVSAVSRRLNIRVPTKQHSTVSSFSSRRSSLVAGAGLGAGASVPALTTGQARRLSTDKQPRTRDCKGIS